MQLKKIKRAVACFLTSAIVATQFPITQMVRAEDSRSTLICGKTEHQHTAECYQIDGSIAYTCSLKSLGVHEHDDSCYDDEGALSCGYADFLIHEHDENCYDDSGRLVCPLPEYLQHVHNASCYETRSILTCEEEETYHVHTSACYQEKSQLICGQDESSGHIHDDSCYTMVLTCGEDHEHTESCYEKTLFCEIPEGTGAHTHTADCYNTETVLVCGKAEDPEGHQHSASCYDTEEVLICNEDELIPHVHTDECYSSGILGDGDLTCGMLEVLAHQHDVDCMVVNDAGVSSEPLCGIEEHTHTEECWSSPEEETVYACGLDEHQHEASCYNEKGNLICGLEEHSHDESCIPPENAAVFSVDGETVTVGGVEYNKEDFQQMTDYLISASITSGGKTYDLKAGETIDGINIYKDFEVSLNLVFKTSTTVIKLNKLYAWKMNGIVVEKETKGQLENSDGEVYGEYFIDTDGTIYAVLDENGTNQSIIDWQLNFSALWQKTEGGEVIIDLGYGKTIQINLDKSRADLLKTRYSESESSLISHWDVNTRAFDEVSITQIVDTLAPADSIDVGIIADYLALNGLQNIKDIFWYSNFRIQYTQPDGTVVDRAIDESELQFSIGGPDVSNYDFIWTPETPITAKANTEVHLTYDSEFLDDFYQYCMLYDVNWFGLKNLATSTLDDGEKVSDNDIVELNDNFLLTKSAGEGVDENGYIDWQLAVNGGKSPLAGDMIKDTLITDISYIQDSFYYVIQTGSSTTSQVSLVVQECATQEEFDAITYGMAPEGESPIYLYGSSFKWFVPEKAAERINNSLTLFYKTTANDVALDSPYNANQSTIGVREDYPQDVGYRELYHFTWTKANDGPHYTEDGKAYTNWTLTANIYPDSPMEWFYIEEELPHKNGLYDSIFLENQLTSGEEIDFKTVEAAAERGLYISISDWNGNDITSDVFYHAYFTKVDWSDGVYRISIGDANHQSYRGGLDASPNGYIITISFPAYLEGTSSTFKEHTNEASLRYKADEDGKTFKVSAESTTTLPSVNDDYWTSKKVIAKELNEEKTKMVLTYDVRYNMRDIGTGAGYRFVDTLDDTSYAKYVKDSLEVYWISDIFDDTPEVFSYPFKDSQFYGEQNLLKIDEDVSYRINSEDEYAKFRMATLNSQTDAGWDCSVPYYKKTSKLYYDGPNGGAYAFYSPQFIYKVEIDLEAMKAANVFNITVPNTVSVYLRDGNLDTTRTNEYIYNGGILQKELIEMPKADNKYHGKYQLVVDATYEKLRDYDRIDIIDEMSSVMSLITDTIVVESAPDMYNYTPLSEDDYRLLYDGMEHKLTCAIDNTVKKNYYRITYEVAVAGMAGSYVDVSNRAYITGFKEQATNVVNTVEIAESSGTAEGATAKLTIKKYNSDNLEISLPGATFKLEKANIPSNEILAEINDLNTKEEIIAYLDEMASGWETIATETTGATGEISWENGVNGVQLPLDTLFKLTETAAPEGYTLDPTPRYFYLSADNGASAGESGLFISKFDVLNFESTVFTGNQKGTMSLLKVDSESGNTLEGAMFGLYTSPDCSEESLFLTSIDYGNGVYYFGDLGFDTTFYLKELKAPTFYEQDDTIYTVTVSATGVISMPPELVFNGSQYVFPNEKLETRPILPEAGGIGLPMQLFGFVMVFTGTWILTGFIEDKKKKQI